MRNCALQSGCIFRSFTTDGRPQWVPERLISMAIQHRLFTMMLAVSSLLISTQLLQAVRESTLMG